MKNHKDNADEKPTPLEKKNCFWVQHQEHLKKKEVKEESQKKTEDHKQYWPALGF